jgi:outer membrane murein-binding lipoprotein Lpp
LTLAKVFYAFRVLRRMVWEKRPTKEEFETSGRADPAPGMLSLPERGLGREAGGEIEVRGERIPMTQEPTSAAPCVPDADTDALPFPPFDVLDDSVEALRFFREHCYRPEYREALEEDTRLLKSKVKAAKTLGNRVQKARTSVACLRKVAEQLRRWKEEEDEEAGEEGEGREETSRRLVAEEEAKVLQELEQQKREYQSSYEGLRDLKAEVEGIQRAVNAHRARLQAAFEPWFAQAKGRREAEARMIPKKGEGTHEEKAGSQGRRTCPAKLHEKGEDGDDPACLSIPRVRKSSASQSLSHYAHRGDPSPDHAARAKSVDDDIAAFYRAKDELLRLREEHQGEPTEGW